LLGDSLQLTATESKEVVDMQSLALHELGHLLGLTHVESDIDQLSVMNPNLFIGEGLTTRKLSRGDVLRIQQIYGCDGEACDIDAVMEKIEAANTPALKAPTAH
jgi:predicted Zn-dependent protease